MRHLIALALLSLHAAFLALSASLPKVIAPVVAATVYLPLWPLASLGAPVLGNAQSGGWASPNLAGWLVLLHLWATFWWTVVAVAAHLWQRKRRNVTAA